MGLGVQRVVVVLLGVELDGLVVYGTMNTAKND